MNDIYDRYFDAWCQRMDGGGQKSTVDMQSAMLDALESGEQLPDEMRFHLVIAFRMVLNREMPALFKRGRGPVVSTLAKSHIPDAVRYIREAKRRGSSYDRDPVTTVVEIYGVKERTVYRWLKAYKGKRLPVPYFLNDADGIRKWMEAGGRLYKEHSYKRGDSLIQK